MNSIRLDRFGKIWAGGSILWRFDPKKEEFMEFPEARTPYGIELDKQGNIWFAEFPREGMIGKMDTETLKITKWTPPATERLATLNKNQPDENYGNSSTHPKTAGPRRITVDSCTLDHPAALAMYQRAGFVPYKQEHKVMDDPRLAGIIPLHREPRRP